MNKTNTLQKRFSLALLLVYLFVLMLPVRALASDQLWDSNTKPATRQKPRLVDNADLLTDSEEKDLLKTLDSLSEKWRCNIVILTVQSHDGYIQDFADDYFDYNGFGADYNGSGILFMLSMEDRSWAISTAGDAIYAFTDYGQEYMVNQKSYSATVRFPQIHLFLAFFRLYHEKTPVTSPA